MNGSPYTSFIDGRFIPNSADLIFETYDPSTEQSLGTVAVATKEDVNKAVAVARQAFDSGPWPKMAPCERANILMNMADGLEERSEALAKLETHDTGLPLSMTQGGHIPRAVAHFRHFAMEAERLYGQVYPKERSYLNLVMREPVGVVAIFSPWNAPLSVTTMNTAAALCCGNTCIIKPSEYAPLTASTLAQIANEAELPPGVLNILQGPAEPTGKALASHDGIDVISFTGGTETGKKIMAAAARGLKRVAFELGGKSPNIIFEDADFERAVDGALLLIFANNGEVCTAGSRILVQRRLYDKFLDSFASRAASIRVGDPLSFDTEMGPLISDLHLKRVIECTQRAVEQGARLICGGKRPSSPSIGHYFMPTVLADVDNQMRIAQSEVFGPVAAVIPFETEVEAIELANASKYGLAAYVWSSNVERALKVAAQIRAGNIGINSPLIRDISVPFGGYKHSGIGRTGGQSSIDLFTEVKATSLPIQPFIFPRLGQDVGHKLP